MRNGAGLLLR
uniref:Uncharacterized protein n=1 Tax=Anguilla anguilla TaxID=7936 RepID=A0A0E9Q986_ANGAN